MRLPAYPTYRPSGVEWLGDVPEDWEVLPLKRRHRVVSGGTPSSGEETYWDGGINWITPEDLGKNETKRIGASRRTLSAQGLKNCGAELVPPKSIVLSTRAPIGHVAVTEKESCTNQGCRSLVPVSHYVSPDYVYYALVASRPVLQASGKGTTFMELSAGALGIHPLPFPPADEQRVIAEFLDRETAKIDTLVATKQTLIDRLKEKRTALISRTVSRGLPPDAARTAGLEPHLKLKASGVEWLSDVPESWDVLEVRRVALRIKTGSTPPTSEERYYDDGTVPWFGPSSFDDEIVVSKPVKWLHSSAVSEGTARLFKAGATMVVTIGATLGKVSSLSERGACNQQITVIEFNGQRVHARFGTYRLKSLEGVLRAIAPSATLPILGQDEIASIKLALPSVNEQRAIADFLDRETAKVDVMVIEAEAAIERLQEYRAALITAAVTGKIDVRTAATP